MKKRFSEVLREGRRHFKRHRTINRITANELCKQASLKPKF
jgi:hypothetical protein